MPDSTMSPTTETHGDYCLIPLPGARGEEQYAIVDAEDYPRLSAYVWHVSPQGYAVRYKGARKNKQVILMHRKVAGTPLGFYTDHINHNRLDNRRSNLRVVTPAENQHNVGKRSRQSYSKYVGLYLDL